MQLFVFAMTRDTRHEPCHAAHNDVDVGRIQVSGSFITPHLPTPPLHKHTAFASVFLDPPGLFPLLPREVACCEAISERAGAYSEVGGKEGCVWV